MEFFLASGIYNGLGKLLATIGNNLQPSTILYIALAVSLLIIISISITTSRSYEVKLIKAIDYLNEFFVANPQIDEDNLIAFNEKMKEKRIPKILRKQWQQYMLYREHKASYYMSFKQCVENPISASTYKYNVSLANKTFNILLIVVLLLGFCYFSLVGEGARAISWGDALTFVLSPFVVILIKYIVEIIFEARLNAVTSDLLQNYQYFEINLDKATSTMPEFVDYEVLFTKKEIKQGIPILYEYLQKRAEQEQKELERARSKEVEHDKYNFDKEDIEGSLVLERAVNETESFIAQRQKYMQLIDQLTTEQANIEYNYKQSSKDYQRKMQSSKENLENLNQQMEQASSNIEANYIKKQQSDEILRQQNLEKDFDIATAKMKNDVQNIQKQIDKYYEEIDASKKYLETAMDSEFDSYAKKVYDKLEVKVNEKEKEKYKSTSSKIKQLEEKLAQKSAELENMYSKYQAKIEELQSIIDGDAIIRQKTGEIVTAIESKKDKKKNKSGQSDQTETINNVEQNLDSKNPLDNTYNAVSTKLNNDESYFEQSNEIVGDISSNQSDEYKENADITLPNQDMFNIQENIIENKPTTKGTIKKGRGRPKKKIAEKQSSLASTKKRGRPRKSNQDIQTLNNEIAEKRGRGRPRKDTNSESIKSTDELNTPKRGRGRPRKVENVEKSKSSSPQQTKKRGRPKKVVESNQQLKPASQPNDIEQEIKNEPVEKFLGSLQELSDIITSEMKRADEKKDELENSSLSKDEIAKKTRKLRFAKNQLTALDKLLLSDGEVDLDEINKTLKGISEKITKIAE